MKPNRTKEFHDLPPGYKHIPKGTVTKTKWLFLSLGLGLGFSAIGAGALWVKMTEPPVAKYKSAASTIHPTPAPIIINLGPDVDIPPCLGQGKDCMEIEPDRPKRSAVPFNKQPDPFGRNYDDKGYGSGWGHGKNNGSRYYGGRGDGDAADGAISDPTGPTTPAGTVAVPALGTWALMLLAALAAMVGGVRLRQRRV